MNRARNVLRTRPSLCFWHLISGLLLLASICSAQDLIIHHIDVGQGDCTFIQTRSKNILVDAGNSGKGKSVVIPYLKSLRVSHINYIIASHYHADHIGGLDEVLDAFDVDTIFDRGTLYAVPRSNIYTSYVKAIRSTQKVAVQPGKMYSIASHIELHFVAADGLCEGNSPMSCELPAMSYTDENSLSIAFTITFVDTVSLSTTNPELRTRFAYFAGGDLTGYDDREAIDLETPVAAVVGPVDAMKINHHGSRSSTTPTFISTLSPSCVFISVGRNNSYGHPAPEVISRLQQTPSIRWIYQTEGNDPTVSKQRIAGTSVLKFFARHDSSYFTVEWNGNGKQVDCYRCNRLRSEIAP